MATAVVNSLKQKPTAKYLKKNTISQTAKLAEHE